LFYLSLLVNYFLSGINPGSYHNFLHTFIIPAGLNLTEANNP
jgi:hypothetical protein